VRAGIAYALTEAMDDGHCGLPAEELVTLTRELLEVPAELVETALSLELQGGAVIADDLDGRRCVFLAGLYRAEREIAERLKALAVGKPPRPLIDANKAIPWVQKRTKLALAETQIEAVRVSLRLPGSETLSALAMRVLSFAIEAAKKSRKRRDARSPALAIIAGTTSELSIVDDLTGGATAGRLRSSALTSTPHR
jgi:hypothetical protein